VACGQKRTGRYSIFKMKTSKLQAFLAITALFFVILTLTHTFFDVHDILPSNVPFLIAQGGARLAAAALCSWGVTTILYIFKK
jgi:hypothetical protein